MTPSGYQLTISTISLQSTSSWSIATKLGLVGGTSFCSKIEFCIYICFGLELLKDFLLGWKLMLNDSTSQGYNQLILSRSSFQSKRLFRSRVILLYTTFFFHQLHLILLKARWIMDLNKNRLRFFLVQLVSRDTYYFGLCLFLFIRVRVAGEACWFTRIRGSFV